MGRPLIVLGDRATNKGTVMEASLITTTHGKQIARVGDRVSCHRKCRIATGDPAFIIDGKAVARHGDKVSCGATLIASQAVSTDASGGSAKDTTVYDDAGKAVPPAPMSTSMTSTVN